MKPFNKKIVLENGAEFYGYGFGADKEAVNEIVFNTSMVGYQEIMSDPSYTDQMIFPPISATLKRFRKCWMNTPFPRFPAWIQEK